jgi:hypothetical protein
LVGTKEDVSNIIDEVTNNPGTFSQPANAAFAARNAMAAGGFAVYAEARVFLGPPTIIGYLAGPDPRLNQAAGAYGESDNQGVMGVGRGGGTGVLGIGWYGVRGQSGGGAAIQGEASGNALAGQFLGNVHVSGDLMVDGDVFLKNRDICERFPASAANLRAGSVMVADKDGRLAPCARAYDKRVIGVISGAGSVRPAVTLGNDPNRFDEVPIALVGKVFCLVDARYGSIEIGDLLTTSETHGHAMKATDREARAGSIIGKALAPLQAGQDLIPVVITLG